ncbi:MAG TPA: anti-sigma factor [Candidatus Binatia bacterium]|nr:anti-sigma factor [Candidatus Binatia bacterium]
MTTAHEPFAELAAGYALGALDAADAEHFERHLAAGCTECTQALADYREGLALAASDLAEPPPARVRETLLRRIEPARPRRPVRLVVGWAASMALAAGIAAVVTGGAVARRYEVRIEQMARAAEALRAEIDVQARTVADLQRRIDEQERTITLVRAESAEQAEMLALLGDPVTRVVSLAGLDPSPGAQARLVWNPRAGGVLVASRLPPPPPGKTYELWAIAGGKPLPAGLLDVGPDGRARLRVAPIEGVAKVDVFAVTLEPAGGVPAPTGPMYLASKEA